MKKIRFEIVSTELLEEYCEKISDTFLQKYQQLEESELSVDTFSFYTSVSAVFSSKIEGENIELDSYVKHKRFGIAFLPDYTRKIDDLYNAYQFAKTSACNAENISAIQKMLTKHILPEGRQGRIRTGNMYVTTADGKIEYVAAAPFAVQSELEKLYTDLDTLLKMKLTLQEVFYFASMLHLVFVKIHPFDDGNGRSSRLIEKWFLAKKLGEKAWLIQSEKNYYLNHQTYYKNIRLLGLEYEKLDYSKALPFLMMLPQSLMLNDGGF
jgi:Fic family protein